MARKEGTRAPETGSEHDPPPPSGISVCGGLSCFSCVDCVVMSE